MLTNSWKTIGPTPLNMEIILNLKLVKDFLSVNQLEKLEQHAVFFQERSKIQFKIEDVNDESITVVVSQGDAKRAFLVSPKELQKVGRSVFGLHFPDKQVIIKLGKYKEPKHPLPKPVKTKDPLTTKVIKERLLDAETDFNKKSIIENRILVEKFLSLEKLRKMEKHAAFFFERSKILFKVVEVQDPRVVVAVDQVDKSYPKAASLKELGTICRSFFEFYLEDKNIQLAGNTLTSGKKVPLTSEQIVQKIKDLGITAEQIAAETGLNLVTLNAWFEGRQKMSTLARAMFHYMLK